MNRRMSKLIHRYSTLFPIHPPGEPRIDLRKRVRKSMKRLWYRTPVNRRAKLREKIEEALATPSRTAEAIVNKIR